ncbi:MAG: hypothetical protein AAB946_01405, partial [Patescibacteria group bacterium]
MKKRSLKKISKFIKNRKLNLADFVLISKIARATPYSAEYLSLLVRNERISGKKFGRNWFISKKSLTGYLRERGVDFVSENFSAPLRQNFLDARFLSSNNVVPILAQENQIGPTPTIPDVGAPTPPMADVGVRPIEPVKQENQIPVQNAEQSVNLGAKLPSKAWENPTSSAPDGGTSQGASQADAEMAAEVRKEMDELEKIYKARINADLPAKVSEGNLGGQARMHANDANKKIEPIGPISPIGLIENALARRSLGEGGDLGAKLPSSPSKIRPWSIIAVAFLALAFILGGFNLKFASAIYGKIADFVGDAITLQGKVPGTHANEVLLINKAGDISIYGHIETKGQFRSYAPQGVAPLVVDSMTTVGNLSADYLDNLSGEDFTLQLVTKNGNVTYDNVKLEGGAEVGKLLLVNGAAQFLNYVSIAKDLSVNGRATIANGIEVVGNSNFLGRVTVKGDMDI